jgi:hypothetical protein
MLTCVLAQEPTVDQVGHDLRSATHDAKSATHAARGAAATARAQQDAAEADRLKYEAQLFAAKMHAETPPLGKETADAVTAGEHAAASAAAANEALESAKGMADPVVKAAEEEAAQMVHTKLAQMYKDLDPWRNKVLADPYGDAQKAGAAAAKPYYDAMKAMQSRIQQYQGAAALAASQGNSLAGAAVSKAGAAQGAMSGGNPIGANQQLVEAHQMMAEAGMLKGTAGSLDGQAKAMNNQIPTYLAAAHWAAWRQMYETNPQDFPPPPADVNSFTPAPPSLLEESETEAETETSRPKRLMLARPA